MNNIIIRADSSSAIGTGHIMRDLVLAGTFRDKKVIFAVRDLDGSINSRIKDSGYDMVILSGGGLDELAGLVREYTAEMVVIDHYGIDYDYEKELKERTGVRLMCVDDTYERHFCDIVYNCNLSADPDKYEGRVPDGTEIRCGAKYILVRDSIRAAAAEKHVRDRNSIFVAMGGADSYNMLEPIIQTLGGLSGVTVHAVATSANDHLDRLRGLESDSVVLHVDDYDIGRLMCRCAFGIVTPSVVMSEVIYCGLPFIAVKVADNQDDMFQYLVSGGFMCLDKNDMDGLKKMAAELLTEQGYSDYCARCGQVFKTGFCR